ncbi:hypothetical protein V501_05563 [Pseudogymnoascus sp. VKM F-4519 (FW-2642)]|nr:hypothetical protein V501_05563 [Pseudogymnoascus sp. VKM F-4519 (FW-2642)]
MKIVNTLLASLIVALVASQEAPAMCITSPISTLAAGEVARASVWNPIGRSCQATLSFADDNFLPVHFDTRPNTCPGAQQMELTIPNEVPNGEAFLSWLCAGDVAALCSRVRLVKGQSDVARLALAQTASLVCEVLATTFATLTTSTSTAATTSTTSGWDVAATSLIESGSSASRTQSGSSTSPTQSGSYTAGMQSGSSTSPTQSGTSGAATTSAGIGSAMSQAASADAITVKPVTPLPTPSPVELCPCN